MFYFVSLFTLVSGISGFFFLLYKHNKKKKLLMLLHSPSLVSSDEEGSGGNGNVGTLLKKTSHSIFVSSLLDGNLMLKLGFIVISGAVLIFISFSGIFPITMSSIAACFFLMVILILFLPDVVKRYFINKKIKNISADLPFIIDMMAICIQSGMTVEKSMQYISDSARHVNKDITKLLARVMLKTEVSGIDAALEQLYQEITSNEVRMFCTTLQQGIRFGSSIYDVLIALSKEIRDIQLIDMEEKVASLSAKMTIPMIGFIMFPLLAIIAGPGLIRMMSLWGG